MLGAADVHALPPPLPSLDLRDTLLAGLAYRLKGNVQSSGESSADASKKNQLAKTGSGVKQTEDFPHHRLRQVALQAPLLSSQAQGRSAQAQPVRGRQVADQAGGLL